MTAKIELRQDKDVTFLEAQWCYMQPLSDKDKIWQKYSMCLLFMQQQYTSIYSICVIIIVSEPYVWLLQAQSLGSVIVEKETDMCN